MRKFVACAVAVLLVAALPAEAQTIEAQKSSRFRILQSIGGGQGKAVAGRLAYDSKDNFLFALPSAGGTEGAGTLLRLQPNGKRFSLLHKFDAADARPVQQVVVHPSKALLLGVTEAGGDNDAGTIFSVRPDGDDFTVLASFGGNGGKTPLGAPVLSQNGKYLYGTTSQGGQYDGGTLWRINTNGTSFAVLHDFGRRSSDGSTPMGGLALSKDGKTLYGTTFDGGSKDLGTIFSIRTDGSRFATLHEFTGGDKDGASPQGAAIFVSYRSEQLFGTTPAGGANDQGVVYRVRSDGTGFKVLHRFGKSTGSVPTGAVAQGFDGLTLYGTTSNGGDHNGGVLFQLRTNGSRFKVLHSFAAKSGNVPLDGPIVSANGRRLYGATSSGGPKNGGSIYVYDLFD